MKWLKWFLGDNSAKVEKELVEIREAVVSKVEERVEDISGDVKVKAKVIADTVEKVAGGYVDDKTGKVYKTEGALKGAITRRKNKAKKAKSTKKAKK